MKALIPIILISRLVAQEGVIDLTSLDNYANQPVPGYITKDNTPPDNAITDMGATLGRVLFYDKRLSFNNSVSCSSCHHQDHAFGDPAVASAGVAGTTGRHSMRLINARFAREENFFWDERASSAEDQATRPIQDHVEMGFSGTDGDPSFADLVVKLSAIPEYQVLFTAVYGDATVDEPRMQKAIAQFVRSIQSFDSKYDTGRAQRPDNQNFPNFTTSENRGKALFLNPPGPGGGAGCAGCHQPPEFDIDPASLNNGIVGALGGGTDLTNTRSPSLRDLVDPDGQPNGGFMHTAVFTNLTQVVAHYNILPATSNNVLLDPRLRRPGGALQNLGLSGQDQSDIIAFLRTLTGQNVYTDKKWSDPFSATGDLELIVLPRGKTTIKMNDDETATISTLAAPGLDYLLQASQTLGDWSTVETVQPDANGNLSSTVTLGSGDWCFRFAYAPGSEE